MKAVFKFALAIALLSSSGMLAGETLASVPRTGKKYNKARLALQSAIFSNWASSFNGNPSMSTVVTAFCESEGVRAARIENSSGNAQYDAECLEAVLGVIPPKSKQPKNFARFIILFNTARKPACLLKARSAEGNLEIFRIPLSVSKQYPTLFTRAELLRRTNRTSLGSQSSAENISDRSVERINRHYESWQKFFQTHPVVTKNEVLTEANELAHQL